MDTFKFQLIYIVSTSPDDKERTYSSLGLPISILSDVLILLKAYSNYDSISPVYRDSYNPNVVLIGEKELHQNFCISSSFKSYDSSYSYYFLISLYKT